MAKDIENNVDNTEQEAVQQPQEGEQQPKPDRYLILRTIKIGVKPGYVLRKVGQAYMVMPTGPRMKDYKGMITLNETGAFLYKESEKEEPTRDKLIEACIAEYGATQEEAEQAVDSFVKQCAQCGLFEYEKRVFDTQEQRELSPEEIPSDD